MHERRPLVLVSIVLGVLVGCLSAIGQFLPVLLERPSSLGPYVAGLSVVMFLLSPVAVFILGYWAGRRVDVAANYARIAQIIGVGSGVASFVGYAAVTVGTPLGLSDQAMVLLSGMFNAAVRIVDFAVTGLAGAAVAHFRHA